MRRILLGVFLTLASATAAAPLPKGLIAQDGRTAPPLRLATMEGKVTDIRNLRGQWLLVHFWASWCAPCRREMPTLQALAGVEPPVPVKLVLVNTAETDDEVFVFLSIVAPDLETLMDRDGQATERWQPRGLPASFLVDPDGRIRYLALGGRDWTSAEYQRFLRSLDGKRHGAAAIAAAGPPVKPTSAILPFPAPSR